MGNAGSKIVDGGLKLACKVTGGLFGRSSEGFHLGPLRLKKNSVGVSLNVGICKVGVKIGRNDNEKFSLEGSVSCGIAGVASGTIKGGIESDGMYAGVTGEVEVGPVKVFAGIAADTKGKVRSLEFGAEVPLGTKVQYSKEHGVFGELFGVSIGKKGQKDSSRTKGAASENTGENIESKRESEILFEMKQNENEIVNEKEENNDRNRQKIKTVTCEGNKRADLGGRRQEERSPRETWLKENKHKADINISSVHQQESTDITERQPFSGKIAVQKERKADVDASPKTYPVSEREIPLAIFAIIKDRSTARCKMYIIGNNRQLP